MKSVIVGTAGHIDHGKTALVRVLTGIDTDRLEEEKRRGITIDLGFANLELASEAGEILRLGFVDVPGHERFVRNMLAGVGGIDLVLLVVAADESIKPQTREHFEICRLLNVQRGIVVLTKSDLVDPETLEVVCSEVKELVEGSFLESAPIVAVSSKTGTGLEDLRRTLARLAAETPAKNIAGTFRLPIDRVFTIKGFGTVVTGTLISGSLKKDDELEVFPDRRHVRVRGIQVHGASAAEAKAGQRTAVNLAGVEVDQLARGMMLSSPGLFEATRRLDVSLHLLPGAKPVKDRARVHLHAYSAETIAEVLLFSGTGRLAELSPGASAYAQLRLAEPLLLFPRDRFVIRQFSPVVTIGGGIVLDPVPPTKLAPEARVEALQKLATAPIEEVFDHLVNRQSAQGVTIRDLVAQTGLLPSVIEEIVSVLMAGGNLVRCGERIVGKGPFAQARQSLLSELQNFHDANRLLPGVAREELRERLRQEVEVFTAILEALVREKKIHVAGDHVSLAGRGIAMKNDEAESKQVIEAAFAAAGLKVPSLKEVLSGLKLDRTRAQQIVAMLLREKILIKVSEDLVFHHSALESLRALVLAQKRVSSKLDVARFKDLTGVSRKYAIPLLEYLDRERVTRRVGDERVIL